MTGPHHPSRDHGGGIDAAAARYGGARADWLDLSTGINPRPYPVSALPPEVWAALPDDAAMVRLLNAARRVWQVPDHLAIVAAPGSSAIIAQMPVLTRAASVFIPGPTYNEHAAAFRAHGVPVTDDPGADAHVHVAPNNPDGRYVSADRIGGHPFTIVDESFGDCDPSRSYMAHADQDGLIILKSMGKFWGLAGLRLGFAIGRPDTLAPPGRAALVDLLGPWAVSGPALTLGARMLEDLDWATGTRSWLAEQSARLDRLMVGGQAAELVGGTTLFRTYAVNDAAALQDRLARSHIWTRVFPYSRTWIRLGLPGHDANWARLEAALA